MREDFKDLGGYDQVARALQQLIRNLSCSLQSI